MTPERRQLLDRLLSERQARSRTKSEASTASMSSPFERFQRVQKLLEHRKALRSSSGSAGSLLSPGSTVGAPSETQYGAAPGSHFSPGSNHSCESASCFETPYCPRQPTIQYSLDGSPIAHSMHGQPSPHGGLQPEGARDSALLSNMRASHNSGSLDQEGFPQIEEHYAEDWEPGPLHAGGAALDSMAQALMSPIALSSEDGGLSRTEDAEERHNKERRAMGADDQREAGEKQRSEDDGCSVYIEGECEQQAGQGLRIAGSLAEPSSRRDGHSDGGEPREMWEEGRGRSGWSAAKDSSDQGSKLLALLAGDAAGPIELDTAMLYSPASTIASSERTGTDAAKPGSKTSPSHAAKSHTAKDGGGWTIGAKHGDDGQLWSPGSAATQHRSVSAPRERRSPQVTTPKEFRLSETSQRHSRAAAARRILEERRQFMTFRPAVLPPRPSSAAAGSDATLTGDARIAQLAKPRTQLWEKCAAIKREEEGGELAHCTFAPKTGRGPTSGPKATIARLPATTRLYAHHDSKYRQWERLKAERDKEDLKDCTFAPAVNACAVPHTPLHRRLSELQRQRSERLARMRLAQEAEDPDATFSPAVNDRSLRMALAKQIRELHDEVPASQRLSAARALPSPAPDVEAGFTFAPELNQRSERLLEDSQQLPGDFFARQRFFHDLKLRRLRALQAEEDADCTFTPETKGQSTVILAASAKSADHVGQTALEQAERLAVADKHRVEGARAEAAHDYYSQFPFRPAINERSRRLVKGGNRLGELTSGERRRERREAMAAEAEARMEAECTFRPRLTAWPRTPAGPGQENRDPADKEGLLRRMTEHRAARDAALEEQRAERENAELAECTFQPTLVTVTAPVQPKEEVKVPGMEAFLANKERARQLAAEQAAREEKAFILHPRDRSGQPLTIPRPFCLRTDLREKETEGRRLQLQAAVMAQSMKECTFHPNTNEALNRQLLQAILASDDDEEDDRSTLSVQTL
ncbi:g2920 [Coccomyxa elongata]